MCWSTRLVGSTQKQNGLESALLDAGIKLEIACGHRVTGLLKAEESLSGIN